MDDISKVVLFGAGVVGREALSVLGKHRVFCFIDNDPAKQGSKLQGIPVYAGTKLPELCKGRQVLVTTDYLESAHEFLDRMGIKGYADYEQYKRTLFRERNIWALNWHLKHTHRQRNKRVLEFARIAQQFDTIHTLEDARDMLARMQSINRQEGNNEWYYRDIAWESRNFGHVDEIFGFAGIPLKNAIYLPNIEHGVNFLDTYWDRPTNLAVFGPDRQRFLQRKLPGKPVFTLGPPIAYARPFYTAEQSRARKADWGKTLLVFGAHSYETATCVFDAEGFAEEVFARYSKSFQSIVACVFYSDLNGPFARAMEQRGAKIVSAGFRFDCNFIRRMRTIFELSDAVATNGVGTHIGYALYFNRPVEFINEEIKYQLYTDSFSQLQFRNYGVFARTFAPNGFVITQEQRQLVDGMWGRSRIRTKEELRIIVALCRQIAMCCHGDIYQYNKAAITVLKQLSYERGRNAIVGKRLLKEALFGKKETHVGESEKFE